MGDREFFLGAREIGRGVLPVHDGKGRLHWRLTEEFREVVVHTAACGKDVTVEIASRVGVSREKHSELSAAFKVDLKPLGLDGLGAEIGEKVGETVSFDVEFEVRSSRKVEPPALGIVDFALYQLVQTVHLEYAEFGFYGALRRQWTNRVECRRQRYHE